jgi:chemotaxis protein CheD
MHEHGRNSEKTISVGMGEWREGANGDILVTNNLGPCIGIAIYEPISKKGFLLHEPLPEDGPGTYERFEDRLRQVFSDHPGSFARMRAWLAGSSGLLASAITPGSEELVAQNRKFVEEAMRDIGIPAESVVVKWTPEFNLSASMTLDCSNGTCDIDFS